MAFPEAPGKCEDCQLFEAPIGGGDRDCCRAPMGLLLGKRKPQSPCQKPENFISIHILPIETTLVDVNVDTTAG